MRLAESSWIVTKEGSTRGASECVAEVMLYTLFRRVVRRCCIARWKEKLLSPREEKESDRSRCVWSSVIDWKSDDPSRLRGPEREWNEAASSESTDWKSDACEVRDDMRERSALCGETSTRDLVVQSRPSSLRDASVSSFSGTSPAENQRSTPTLLQVHRLVLEVGLQERNDGRGGVLSQTLGVG